MFKKYFKNTIKEALCEIQKTKLKRPRWLPKYYDESFMMEAVYKNLKKDKKFLRKNKIEKIKKKIYDLLKSIINYITAIILKIYYFIFFNIEYLGLIKDRPYYIRFWTKENDKYYFYYHERNSDGGCRDYCNAVRTYDNIKKFLIKSLTYSQDSWLFIKGHGTLFVDEIEKLFEEEKKYYFTPRGL